MIPARKNSCGSASVIIGEILYSVVKISVTGMLNKISDVLIDYVAINMFIYRSVTFSVGGRMYCDPTPPTTVVRA
jgi:hypothetical protein